jgi:hypothetical protein
MAARAAIVIVGLAVVAAPGPARAQDDPACAQYHDPMAYNACLARRGPRANDVGAQQGHAAQRRSVPVEAGTADKGPAWRPTHRRGRVHIEFQIK